MTLASFDVRAVSAVIKQVVKREALSKFRRLGVKDVSEKRSGSFVTTANLALENALADELLKVIPGSNVLGKEAAAEDASVLDALHERTPVWLIDPIDGTAQFVSGQPRFSTLVALRAERETIAAWIYAPVDGLMMTAHRRLGTHLNGARVQVGQESSEQGLSVAVASDGYQTSQDRENIGRLLRVGIKTVPCDSVGLDYIDLAIGRRTAAVFGWENPWDHAAGLLAHAEAGGIHATFNGAPFIVEGNNRLPLIIAPDSKTLELLHGILCGLSDELPKDSSSPSTENPVL